MSTRSWISDAVRTALSLLLAAGLCIGVYLAWHHENQLYGDATARLANCPESDTVNCELVNTSRWAELLGVPIAAYAIPTYLLVMILLWAGRTRASMMSYVFCIGLMTALASLFLLYISKVELGFVCIWCIRLYIVNVSIPVLSALAARRSPIALLRETAMDLKAWPGTLRFASAAFVVLLALTVTVQQSYRADLRKRTAEEMRRIMSEGGPTVPAVPESDGTDTPQGSAPANRGETPSSPGPVSGPSRNPSGAAKERSSTAHTTTIIQASFIPFALPTWLAPRRFSSIAGSESAATSSARPDVSPNAASVIPPATAPQSSSSQYRLAGPLRQVSRARGELKTGPFDLQSRLGRGKPIALIFWAPGFPYSERALGEWTAFFKQNAPQFEVYAVAGRGATQRDEEIWEVFSMIDLPPDLPLLVDDDFIVSKGLDVLDVPNVTLFGSNGGLVIAKMKHPDQMLVVPPANEKAGDVVRRVATGVEVPTIKRMFPYYPAAELYGRCAPTFILKKFNTNEPFTFTGKSPAGRPTMLVFWSSTCKHCQVEIPQIVAWLKTHPGVLDVVSVTHIKADRPGEASHRKITEAYIRAQAIPWPVLEDPDHSVEELYGSISTPTIYFIAPDGRVSNAWFYAHEEGFNEAIARELGQAAPGTACRPATPAATPRMEFTVAGPDGKRVPLSSLLDKPAVVHFWATWCKPCVEELPSLLRFRDKLDKLGTGRVILVSVEDENAGPQIASFQKTHGLELRSCRSPKGGLADRVDLAYRVPRSFLLGPGGVVLGSRQGSLNWDDPGAADKVLSRLLNGGIAGHN